MKRTVKIFVLAMVMFFGMSAWAEEPIVKIFWVKDFPREESAIRGSVKEALEKIIGEIKIIQKENSDRELVIGVAGSASQTGTRAYNDRLSSDRAEATAGYMDDKLPGAVVNLWHEGDQHDFQGVRIECRLIVPEFSLKKEIRTIETQLSEKPDLEALQSIIKKIEELGKLSDESLKSELEALNARANEIEELRERSDKSLKSEFKAIVVQSTKQVRILERGAILSWAIGAGIFLIIIGIGLVLFVVIRTKRQVEVIDEETHKPWPSDLDELAEIITNASYSDASYSKQGRKCPFCKGSHQKIKWANLKRHFFSRSNCLSEEQRKELEKKIKERQAAA